MSNTTLRKNQKNQLNNTGINQQKLRAFAGELSKDIHTQRWLSRVIWFTGKNDHQTPTPTNIG